MVTTEERRDGVRDAEETTQIVDTPSINISNDCHQSHSTFNPQDIAREYIRRGWAPIPVPHRKKNPGYTGWQKLRITESNVPEYFSRGRQNISVLLGEPSNGLVDIDIDGLDVIPLAPLFLPDSGAVFGRKSKPRSHWLYYPSHELKPRKFSDPVASEDERATLVEIRSKGQTVFPSSVHPTGEQITWNSNQDPARVEANELETAVQHLAAASLLVRHWPGEGSRQDAALALAGGMLRSGWDEEEVEWFIQVVADAAGDEEAESRAKTVRNTARKLEADEAVTGWASLEKYLDESVVTLVRSWLAIELDPIEVHEHLRFETTDLGNAQRLAAAHGDEIRYDAARKSWFVWDGTRWAEDNTLEIVRRATYTVKAIYGEAANTTDDRERVKIAQHAAKSQAAPRIDAMIKLARAHDGLTARPEQFDTNPMVFNVQNGTIDLRTGELRPHSQTDMITKLAPVKFDPTATCPRWLEFLECIMWDQKRKQPKHEIIAFLQRVAGYTLTGLTGERVMFVLFGTGANGKSTFQETLQALMGDFGKRTPTSTLLVKNDGAASNDVARLKGARYVFASEADEDKKLAEAFIKDVTGGDTISARYLYGEFFEFTPEFKLFLATNHKPEIRGTDDGIWSRIRLIPFDVQIPPAERDIHLKDKLRAELPGILNWAIRGCLDWQRGGVAAPEEVDNATKEYRADMDVLAEFLVASCEDDKTAVTPAQELYTAYSDWCYSNRIESLSKSAFGLRLKERGYESTRGARGIRQWRGLRVADKF